MKLRFPLLAALELAGAAALGTVVALVWTVLGTAWTWAVDPYIRFQPLSARAVAIIVVPAFAMGWLFFLIRRPALQSRSNWVGAAFVCALVGAALHRAVFLDENIWSGPALSVGGELDQVLQVLVRRACDHDFGFLAITADPALFMSLGTVAAACVLAAACHSPIRRLLS